MSPATPNFTSPAMATKLMLPAVLVNAALRSMPPLAVISRLPETLTAWVLASTSLFFVPARKFMLPCCTVMPVTAVAELATVVPLA